MKLRPILLRLPEGPLRTLLLRLDLSFGYRLQRAKRLVYRAAAIKGARTEARNRSERHARLSQFHWERMK